MAEHLSERKRAIVVYDSQAALRALKEPGVKRVSETLGKVLSLGRGLGEKAGLFKCRPTGVWSITNARMSRLMSIRLVRSVCIIVLEAVVVDVKLWSLSMSDVSIGEGVKWELEKVWEKKGSVFGQTLVWPFS